MAYVSLCKALYDYTAAAEDELTFTEDALLYVVEADDPEWWKAKLKTSDDDNDEGPVGLIPANYVEEAEPIRASKALYDYAKQNDDELDIEEDEMLSVFEVKGEWLLIKRQQDGFPVAPLGFVPANYVDEVAAVDGVTEPMQNTVAEEEAELAHAAAAAPALAAATIPIARPITSSSSSAPLRTAKNDDIKMWAVSELDEKKKKKKGTLGIGNSSLFFASESDKAPVRKIGVLSIVGHTIESKGKQLNLELDDEGAAKASIESASNTLRFVMSNKSDAEEVWKKIEDSQRKTREANEETDEDTSAAAATAVNASSVPAPPPLPTTARSTSVAIPTAPPPPPVAASILPPPTRSAALAAPSAAPLPPQTNGSSEEKAIALYDFDAQGDDELTVKENEALVLVERETDDWWKVRNMQGEEGVVPASYVEVGGEQVEAEEEDEVVEKAAVAGGAGGGVAAITAGTAAVRVGNEKDKSEAKAARDAARRAIEEEEAKLQREEEEEAAERARMLDERRARLEEQKRAREAEERRRQALKAQNPAPTPPRAPPTTATSSTSASASRSRDVAIPNGRSAPARPKEASSKSKPSPARTRVWHDRSGQFKVEAEFLGFNQGKIRLHKLNGVVIEVAIEKMSQADISYLEEVTGRKLAPARSSRSEASNGRDREREREKRREQEREQRRRQESARGPKRNVDWFEFFLASGVDIDDCTRYASAFERDKIDEGVLPELDADTLRKIGLREGDIIRVIKFIAKRYSKGANGTSSREKNDPGAQIRADEALARKLQEQEQAARRNGTTPPPNLFSGPDGALKNNTRRGRPTNNAQRSTSTGVDAASLAAASESLARTTSPPIRSNTTSPDVVRAQPTSTSLAAASTGGFDDDAWTPRPPSAKPATPAAVATPPPQPPRPSSTSIAAAAAVPSPAAVAPPPAPTPPAPPAVEAPPKPEAKADPNSALFDKLAAMKPASPAIGQRPGASPLGAGSMYGNNGARGPYAPVAHNQSMLQPLIPTQGTGQFVPTSMGYQPTGMQMQATGWGGMLPTQQPQMTSGYMNPQATGFNGYGGGSSMQQPQSPFGGSAGGVVSPMGMQPTGFAAWAAPPQPGQQPQSPQQTSQQYGVQQQQQQQQEINNGPERYSAANVFGQMKQGNMHQAQHDANAAPQSSQKYDALRPQPTGFQPGGYLNPQFTGYGGYGGGGYQ